MAVTAPASVPVSASVPVPVSAPAPAPAPATVHVLVFATALSLPPLPLSPPLSYLLAHGIVCAGEGGEALHGFELDQGARALVATGRGQGVWGNVMR